MHTCSCLHVLAVNLTRARADREGVRGQSEQWTIHWPLPASAALVSIVRHVVAFGWKSMCTCWNLETHRQTILFVFPAPQRHALIAQHNATLGCVPVSTNTYYYYCWCTALMRYSFRFIRKLE